MSQGRTEVDDTADEGSTDEDTAKGKAQGRATDQDVDALRAQLELLREENERLRDEYSQAKQARHKRTAIGLGGIGIVAVLGAFLFPAERTVLLALGATGLFGGLLTWLLTPERFVAASVGEQTYAALADNFDRITAALGLQDDRVYLPVDHDGQTRIQLFVPQHAEYDLPDPDAMSTPFVVPENGRARGLAVRATGDELRDDIARSVPGEFATEPAMILEQVADGLVEQFELADSITVEASDGQATVGVTGSVYGDLDRFDHPIPSTFGATLSNQLDTAVSVSIQPAKDRRADVLVTCEWDGEDEKK